MRVGWQRKQETVKRSVSPWRARMIYAGYAITEQEQAESRRMIFLHAGIFRSKFRDLVGSASALKPIPIEPITIECPKCGDLYIADLALDEEPFDLEEQEWEALYELEAECPDHRYCVAVGP